MPTASLRPRALTAAAASTTYSLTPQLPQPPLCLAAGLTVYVIPPGQLKNLRSRYGSAGNKDDRFDAFVLADTVRTDRRRLRPLVCDSPAAVTLRATCRARKDLVGHRVALTNQLRAHLQLTFPRRGAVDLFADLDSAISLRFLARFPNCDRADWLSPKRLEAWLRSVGYSGRTNPTILYARLSAAARGVTGPDGQARAQITLALLATIRAVVEQISALAAQITEQLAAHPDHEIFQSLPQRPYPATGSRARVRFRNNTRSSEKAPPLKPIASEATASARTYS